MALDQFKLLSKITLAAGGIDASTTTLNFATGQGAKLPSAGPFNLVVWDASIYDDPADDPNAESIRVPASYAGGDTATGCSRGQEGTTAKAHNTANHTFKAILHLGTKFVDDLLRKHDTGEFRTGSNVRFGVGSMNSVAEMFEVEQAKVGIDLLASVRNTDNANGASRAGLRAQVGGTAGGDPVVLLVIPSGTNWHVGVDNSDLDKLKIGFGNTIGAAGVTGLAITTGLLVGMGTETPVYELDVQRTISAGNPTIRVTNLDNTSSSSDATIRVEVAGTAAGDPGLSFGIIGGTPAAYRIGMDNSDGDSFKISESTALGTNDRLKIASGGKCTIGFLATDVVLTASLPAAATAQDGRILIEDGGAGNRNLIIYAGGERFRIDGGANI